MPSRLPLRCIAEPDTQYGFVVEMLQSLPIVERVKSARQDTPLGRANLPPPIGSLKAEAEKELTHTYSAEAFGDLLLSHLSPSLLSLLSTAYECCLDTR